MTTKQLTASHGGKQRHWIALETSSCLLLTKVFSTTVSAFVSHLGCLCVSFVYEAAAAQVSPRTCLFFLQFFHSEQEVLWGEPSGWENATLCNQCQGDLSNSRWNICLAFTWRRWEEIIFGNKVAYLCSWHFTPKVSQHSEELSLNIQKNGRRFSNRWPCFPGSL